MFAAHDLAWLGTASRVPPTASRVVATVTAVIALNPMPAILVIDVSRDEAKGLIDSAGLRVLRSVDVLMLIERGDEELREQAMTQNIACVARSISDEQLLHVISARVERVRAFRATDPLNAGCLGAQSASFVIRTLQEAESLALVLSMFCREPARRVTGFVELLINAIEHGNLEISRDQKLALLKSGRWYETMSSRLVDSRYVNRVVRVTFKRSSTDAVFTIEDDGAGFDCEKVLANKVEQSDALHGRGIALARLMSFDELRYEGRGNRVVAVIR